MDNSRYEEIRSLILIALDYGLSDQKAIKASVLAMGVPDMDYREVLWRAAAEDYIDFTIDWQIKRGPNG